MRIFSSHLLKLLAPTPTPALLHLHTMELADELREKVVRYLPRLLLKYLFLAPAIGGLCFARYYADIKLEGETAYVDDPHRGAEIYVSDGFSHPAIRSLDENGEFTHIEFTYKEDFEAFCAANATMLSVVRLKSITLDWRVYQKLDRCFLDHFDCVNLTKSYTLEDNERLASVFEKFQNDIQHQVGLLNVSWQSRVMQLTRLQPRFRTLRTLVLKRAHFQDVAACFAELPNLHNLKLIETELRDTQLEYLPRSLRSINLEQLLHLSNRNIPLMFPENLQILEIDHTLHYPVSFMLGNMDLSPVSNLECLYLTSCVLASFLDLLLPNKIKHLLFKSCYNLLDLNGIESLTHLQSIHILDPIIPDWIDYLSHLPMPLGMQHINFCYYQELNMLAENQDIVNYLNAQLRELQTLPFAGKPYLYSLSPSLRESSLLITGQNNLTLFEGNIVGPIQLLSILKIPHIKSLKHFKLPEALEKLHVSLKLDGLDVQLPQTLKELKFTGCGLKRFKIREFLTFNKLETLDISGNELKNGSVCFEDFPSSLEKVSLGDNHFTKVDLSHCKKLKYVDLLSCKLDKISKETIGLPDCVETLQLCGNDITSIESSFTFPSQLKSLSMTGHHIPHLGSGEFWSKLLDDIELLELTPSRSTSYSGVEPIAFKRLKSLLLGNARDYEYLVPIISQLDLLKYLLLVVQEGEFDLEQIPKELETLDLNYFNSCTVKGNLDHFTKIREFNISMEYFSVEDDYSHLDIEQKLRVPSTLESMNMFEIGTDDPERIFDFSKSLLLRKVNFFQLKEQEPHDTTNDKIHSQDKIQKTFELVEKIKKMNPNFGAITVNTWVPSQALVQRCREIGVEVYTKIT